MTFNQKWHVVYGCHVKLNIHIYSFSASFTDTSAHGADGLTDGR